MMARISSIPEKCRGAAARIGVLGLLFSGSLAVFLLLYFTGLSGFWLVIDTAVATVTGIWLSFRLTRYLMGRSLWSLRNRLLTVYLLIGILPILLILALVGLSAYALTSELAISLTTSELDRKLKSIRGAAEALEKMKPVERKYAAPNMIPYFRERFPGLCLYTDDVNGVNSYPAGTPPLGLPEGWQDAEGLLQRDGQFYGWAHLTRNGESFTAMAPLASGMLADLVLNVGQIVLSDVPHSHGTPDNLNLRFEGPPSDGERRSKSGRDGGTPRSPFAVHNVGRLPNAVNRFDVELDWPSVYPHYDWSDPNRKHPAVLMVRSRPSAVFAAIFTGTDQMRSVLLGIMFGVAVLFLLVEVVALVIGVSLATRITGAVNELYEGTRRVIYGDFRNRISVRGQDQVAELTTSFNQMTGNLERLLSVEKEKERLQAELEIAREVQTQLYPRGAPPERGLRLTVCCEPARVVSGDYYDYEAMDPTKLAFAIGDVAGKGISAALLMATVQAALRAQIRAALGSKSQNDKPLGAADLVSELNKQLYAHTAPEKYLTFFFAIFDEGCGTLTYTNAGHLAPILIRNREATMLDSNGTVVGAFPFSEYDESHIQLQPNDLLVCYTDGITEPENAYGEMFGEERLIDIVSRSAHEDDNVIIGKVIEAVRNWHSAAELPDDMTLLIARRLEAAV